ncbi:MAG: 50S ribosomal protein L25, partial [Desulfovibrio sp.]|nr:50S ribosomal protein L25 [Desulfovibrio sp.]
HIDYYGVDLEKEVKVEVPLVFTGTAKGVKLGGMLETYREEVLISAKPLDMPHSITVDVTDLGVNQSITVEKLQLPEGCKAVYDNNFSIVAVIEKSSDAAEDEGEATEGAEGAATPAAAAK